MCSAVCGYLLIQANFQALQSNSWGFAIFENTSQYLTYGQSWELLHRDTDALIAVAVALVYSRWH